MKILVTNDDGIRADGLRMLTKIMSQFGKVYVVAPAENNSAMSHAMTMHRPLKVATEVIRGAKQAISVDGTPADCVKYALSFLKIEPDLVVSGINDEGNIGTDILYSGTVSGAIEANLYQIPAIAISTSGTDFESVETYLPSLLNRLFKKPLEGDVTLNINFPAKCVPRGVKITTVGVSLYDVAYTEESGGYRISGTLIDIDQSEETDVKAVLNGYISITPLKLKLDDEHKRMELEKIFK